MARLFHEVAGEGLAPLGIRPAHFPLLAALWFDAGELSLAKFEEVREASPELVAEWVREMVADGLVENFPASRHEKIVPTAKAIAARDGAVAAAVRANQAGQSALSEAEMTKFVDMMNRVIDALQAAKS